MIILKWKLKKLTQFYFSPVSASYAASGKAAQPCYKVPSQIQERFPFCILFCHWTIPILLLAPVAMYFLFHWSFFSILFLVPWSSILSRELNLFCLSLIASLTWNFGSTLIVELFGLLLSSMIRWIGRSIPEQTPVKVPW